jgi:hypothetical protein
MGTTPSWKRPLGREEKKENVNKYNFAKYSSILQQFIAPHSCSKFAVSYFDTFKWTSNEPETTFL